jgi:ADP-ribosylglycohydrolase
MHPPTPSSTGLLSELFSGQRIDIQHGTLFCRQPGAMPSDFDFQRVEGMCLGVAIGDALGNTSEGMSPEARRQMYGDIRDYLPHSRFEDRRGYPSDDTQLAFWTLEQILADGRFVPENIADRFCRDQIFGIGSTVRQFIANRKAGKSWQEAGVKSAGNGALMRIATILIPHLRTAAPELWADTAICAMLTHNDSASIASCLAFVRILWDLLKASAAPPPAWWLETFVATARELETDENYTSRSPQLADFKGTIWQLAGQEVASAYQHGLSVADACARWQSGAYLVETVPSVLYILMRHGHDPEDAIIRAATDTADNDTIAAIVGAAVGALHGKAALPRRWIENLSGRTKRDDDGRIFQLLDAARQKWWTT